jgi:uncharacterized protein YegL
LPYAAANATPGPGGNERGRDVAGKSSLGDLEVSTDGGELYVVNLHQRRIYRIDATTGVSPGSFEHGAASLSWSNDARPFGLKFRDGRLYHGVVNSAETTQQRSDLEARIYRSAPDGGNMEEVVAFPLDYRRGVARIPGVAGESQQTVPLDWQPWHDGVNDLEPRAIVALYPQPIVSDIEFAANGDMLVAIRDRHGDMSVASELGGASPVKAAAGLGDVVRLRQNGDGWDWTGPTSLLPVAGASHADHGLSGGLASLDPLDLVVANQIRLFGATVFGDVAGVSDAVWFDSDSNPIRREWVCRLPSFPKASPTPKASYKDGPGRLQHNEWIPATGAGDLEVLCGAIVTATPTTPPTPTAKSTTTPTPLRLPAPIYLPIAFNETQWRAYLPIALKEECHPGHTWADIVLVIDTSSSMDGGKLSDAKEAAINFVRHLDLVPTHDQVGVVRFDSSAEVRIGLGRDQRSVEQAIRGLAARRGTRIDLGLLTALHELRGPRRLAANTGVMVLLTDGIQTAELGAELIAARAVRDEEVRLYTIGLGADVDEATLVEMAGDRSRYFFAPDSSHLLRIYQEVAYDIDCPAADFWGRR